MSGGKRAKVTVKKRFKDPRQSSLDLGSDIPSSVNLAAERGDMGVSGTAGKEDTRIKRM